VPVAIWHHASSEGLLPLDTAWQQDLVRLAAMKRAEQNIADLLDNLPRK